VSARWSFAGTSRSGSEPSRRCANPRRSTTRWSNTLPVNVYRKDLDGRFTFVNSRFCQFKGLPEDQILGKTAEAMAPDGLAGGLPTKTRPSCRLANPRAGGERHDLGERVRYFHVVKSPVFAADGSILGTQGMFYDITQTQRGGSGTRL